VVSGSVPIGEEMLLILGEEDFSKGEIFVRENSSLEVVGERGWERWGGHGLF
jgi:hypothetical protein